MTYFVRKKQNVFTANLTSGEFVICVTFKFNAYQNGDYLLIYSTIHCVNVTSRISISLITPKNASTRES